MVRLTPEDKSVFNQGMVRLTHEDKSVFNQDLVRITHEDKSVFNQVWCASLMKIKVYLIRYGAPHS